VALNIGETRSDQPLPADESPKARAPSRRLVQQVVDELSSWNPREFVAAFQRWHQGQVSLVHLNVLMLLSATGPMSMSRLAEALDISVASVTGVVDRMESRGLVERRRDTDDRRVIMVTTAEGGNQIFAEIDQRRRQSLGLLLNYLSRDELAGLLKGHRALRAARQELAMRGQKEQLGAVVGEAKASRLGKIDALLASAKRGDTDVARS
jgi:DNA-binding MarR family transcriptional regulator